MDQIIKARFMRDGKPSGREYSYLSKEAVEVGDTVLAETKNGEAELEVTQVNIPESEIEAFRDKMKYIIGKKPEQAVTDGENLGL